MTNKHTTKTWTICDCANIGRQWGRMYTLREAYDAARQRSNESMKIWIDRKNKVVSFRGSTYL